MMNEDRSRRSAILLRPAAKGLVAAGVVLLLPLAALWLVKPWKGPALSSRLDARAEGVAGATVLAGQAREAFEEPSFGAFMTADGLDAPGGEGDVDSTGQALAGTERWHRERFEAIAGQDPSALERIAPAILEGDAGLPERIAFLQVCWERDPILGDELFALVLDRNGDEPALQESAFHHLLRRSSTDQNACARLHESVVMNRAMPVRLRCRAQRAVMESASQEVLDRYFLDAVKEQDAAVRLAALRGLERNDSLRARQILAGARLRLSLHRPEDLQLAGVSPADLENHEEER